MLFSFCTAFTIAFAVLWWRSVHDEHDYFSVSVQGVRYLIESRSGQVLVIAPPSVTAQEKAVAKASVHHVRNDQVRWWVNFRIQGNQIVQHEALVAPLMNVPKIVNTDADLQALLALSSPARTSALLMALEDPSRFAAAHLFLTLPQPPQPGWMDSNNWDGRRLRVEWNGLRVNLLPRVPEAQFKLGPDGSKTVVDRTKMVTCTAPQEIEVDQTQHAQIRAFWKRRLGTTLVSVPHWVFVALSLAPWLASAGLMGRKYVRARRGCCMNCGYDLRMGHKCCPECGQIIMGA